MNATFLLAALLVGGAGSPDYRDRPRNPLAPSLPTLTKEEVARFEKVIERFVLYDTGKLTDAEGRNKANAALYALGPEAIFVLIDGFNQAANIEASCPAVIIGKKIESILRATDDVELLSFARDNIGAGVTSRKHQGMVDRLRTAALLRRGQLQRANLGKVGGPGLQPGKALSSMSLAELDRAAGRERGEALKLVLQEAAKRNGPQTLPLLAKAAANAESRQLGRVLLAKHVNDQSPSQVRQLLKHDSAEVRRAAAETVGSRKLRYGDELIALLQDGESDVRQAARRALTQLAGGEDFGPEPEASFGDRETAVRRWREWWRGQH